MSHETFIREAIRLSLEGMQKGEGGPFGAIVVKDGKIIAKGNNRVTSSNDPTAHAEVVAIREACRILDSFQLDGCVLYTSCEPCPMCLGAIYWSRVDAVYFANERLDAAAIGFDDALIYDEINTEFAKRKIPMKSLLREEALLVFQAWQEKSDKKKY